MSTTHSLTEENIISFRGKNYILYHIYICNICYCTALFFKNFAYILHQSRLTWLKIFLKGLCGQHEECLG